MQKLESLEAMCVNIDSVVCHSEDGVSGGRANSGGVASFCLDHRHSPPEMSLYTPDGR